MSKLLFQKIKLLWGWILH